MLGFGKVRGKLTEVLYPERRREPLIDIWKANFFICFPPSGLERGFGRQICLTTWEGSLPRNYRVRVSKRLLSLASPAGS